MIYKTSIVGADVAVTLHERFKLKEEVGNKVLDLGFGNGEIVAQFLRLEYNVIGVDINPESCKLLLNSLVENNISTDNLTLHNQDITAYTFSEGPYSAIICQNVLHFIQMEQVKRLVREMIHCLKSGGFLWLVVHYKDQPYVKNIKKEIISLFDETDIESLLDETIELYYHEKAWKPKIDQSIGISYLLRRCN